MIDGSLVVAAVALAAVVALTHPVVTAIAAGIVLFACVQRGALRPSRAALVIAALVGLVADLRANALLARDAIAAERAVAALPRPERCELVGTVATMPRMRGVISADVMIESISCEARAPPLDGHLARIHDLGDAVTRGARVRVIAQLAPARRPHNPDLGDPRPLFARRGYSLSGSAITVEVLTPGRPFAAWIDRARTRLRQGIAASFVSTDIASIARAMVLGEEDLGDADDEAFRRSGLTHLLAVSGSHVALVVGGLVAVFRALLLRWEWLVRRIEVSRVAAAFGVPLACVYEQLSGDSGSARRATLMAIVVLLVRAAGRRVDLARTLGLSILAALAIDPLAPFDVSFSLSVAATIGLVAFAPRIDAFLTRLRPHALRRAVSATAAASAACAPLVASISGTIPLLGLVANLVAVPIGELAALPLCNVAALMGVLLPAAASRMIGDAAGGALVLLRGVARITAAPEHAVISAPPPTALQLALLISATTVAFVLPRRRLSVALVAASALLLLEVLHVRRSQPRGRLRVTVLDVGQGDSTLIDLPEGGAILIDAGGEVGSSWDPGRVVVGPVLAARRRSVLDVAILSHPHPDHFLGLRSALARVQPHSFWDNGQSSTAGELGALLASLRAQRVAIESPSCGARRISGATIEILHPCPADPDRGANDNSLVLRISYGRRRVLLVGDAEREAEDDLLRRPELLSADFLKVGHHGSRTSSSRAFLAAVHPSIATISCGVRNRFGHPHATALQTLHASGARVLRTDLDGAIQWTTDGDAVAVVTAREGW